MYTLVTKKWPKNRVIYVDFALYHRDYGLH
jgi:hypothetical protein